MSLDIHYFVRTTGLRHYDYFPLIATPLYDYKRDPINSFIRSLETIDSYNSVLLEDDLLLCQNFQVEIEKVIEQYPDVIINFFTDPFTYRDTYLRYNNFDYNQCTYYPKNIAGKIATRMRQMYPMPEGTCGSYCNIQNMAMADLKIPHLVYRPSLVQHIGIDSILRGNREASPTFSIYFIDYLKEAGIQYKDANTPENIEKLQQIAKNHKEEYMN